MDITAIIKVMATVAGVGAALAFGLELAYRKFFTEPDQGVSAVEDALPGINCGSCGYPGCGSYAEAVAKDTEVPADLCIPGGSLVAEKIAQITGKSVEGGIKRVSMLRCARDIEHAAPLKYQYSGVQDCAAVHMLHEGAFLCRFACAGLGDCANSCPAGAIRIEKGRPVIAPEVCTGCGICVKVCPRDVLILSDYPGKVNVFCRNTKPAKEKRSICPSACLGCSICARSCPNGAIKIENNLATVNNDLCPPDCDMPCLLKCPTSAILATGIQQKK